MPEQRPRWLFALARRWLVDGVRGSHQRPLNVSELLVSCLCRETASFLQVKSKGRALWSESCLFSAFDTYSPGWVASNVKGLFQTRKLAQKCILTILYFKSKMRKDNSHLLPSLARFLLFLLVAKQGKWKDWRESFVCMLTLVCTEDKLKWVKIFNLAKKSQWKSLVYEKLQLWKKWF